MLRRVEAAASAHRGRPWVARGFTDLNDRASHPCGIVHGEPFSVFAKLGVAGHFRAELAALRLLRERAAVATPEPVGAGLVAVEAGALLLLEAVFRAYREVRPIDPDFEHRRELWRLPAYLAVVAVAGTYLDRLARAIAHCQGR